VLAVLGGGAILIISLAGLQQSVYLQWPTNICNSNVQLLANDINAFLQSVSTNLQPLSAALIPSIGDYFSDDFIIKPFEVERKLSNINVNKSSGPDNIPNGLLRDNSVCLAELLCAIYYASLREGVVPAVWKQANVVPIPKTHAWSYRVGLAPNFANIYFV